MISCSYLILINRDDLAEEMEVTGTLEGSDGVRLEFLILREIENRLVKHISSEVDYNTANLEQ